MKRLSELSYPVQTAWLDFEIPFVGNDTLAWKGSFPLLVDAEGEAFKAEWLSFEAPWYYCTRCGDRQAMGAKFCSGCGRKMDWEHTDERDGAADAAFRKKLEAKIEELRVSSGQGESSPEAPEGKKTSS